MLPVSSFLGKCAGGRQTPGREARAGRRARIAGRAVISAVPPRGEENQNMTQTVVVAGVGMVPFHKPGASKPYHEMGAEAARLALADAGIAYDAVQQVYAGYVYGDSTSGQRAIYDVGMSGVPIVNVNNNCSSGSTALFLARQAVEAGMVDCALAVGFEQMQPGALGEVWRDRPSALGRFNELADEMVGETQIPLTLRFFGGAGREYMERYDAPLDLFAEVRA